MKNKEKIRRRQALKERRLEKELQEYDLYSCTLPNLIRDTIKKVIVEHGMCRIHEAFDAIPADALFGLRYANSRGAFFGILEL